MNMLVLFFLGPVIEQFYGSKEFVRLYLVMLVFSTLAWSVFARLGGPIIPISVGPRARLPASWSCWPSIPADDRVAVLHYPDARVGCRGFVRRPGYVRGDGWEAGLQRSHLRRYCHLAGAAFAAVYYWRRWNLTSLTERLRWPRLSFRRKPPLRVHRPEREDRAPEPRLGSRSHSGQDFPRRRGKPYRQGTRDARSRQPRISPKGRARNEPRAAPS